MGDFERLKGCSNVTVTKSTCPGVVSFFFSFFEYKIEFSSSII